jgi:hypothetical protein
LQQYLPIIDNLNKPASPNDRSKCHTLFSYLTTYQINMSKILFLSQPTFGHFNPIFSIALQMQAEGHQVEFMIPGSKAVNSNIGTLKNAAAIPKILEKNHIPIELISLPIPLAATFFAASNLAPKLSGYNELEFLLRFLPAGLKYITQEILARIDRSRPDAIVTDYTFLASYIAAEVAKVPCAVIYHTGLPFRARQKYSSLR